MTETTRNTSGTTLVALYAACLTTVALGYSMTQAWADGDMTTYSVGRFMGIPYHGYLMLDATPADGPVRLRFELFEEPSGGAAPQWVEERTVQARDGRFSVELGGEPDNPDPRFPFNAMLLDGEPLWVAITVLEDDGRGGVREIELSGRQAIEPAVSVSYTHLTLPTIYSV